ncbi:phosphomannomutase/phosphoglucomutase [Candidatus Woesearchaeota archaeon CG10_big_fil_rev_8_21_14_0_10_37_12]|nr:MAG: phosphomannomutase/phosphoglucomutase [Candidatus Woesearchaeota archaeon CG10_big_fil_rev_8_21_14_0_10_37_12]
MSAFRSFDIRGIYPEEVNEKLAYNVGRAIVQFFKAKTIVVGRDCRTSSLALQKALIYGITDQGCNVINIGLCNTPMLYYASFKHHAIMITASHNPAKYNGIKIVGKGFIEIGYKNGLNKIEKLVNSCHFPEPKKLGRATSKNILSEYIDFTKKTISGKYKKLCVLIDCGNGMAGYVVPKLLAGLPIKYNLLYGKLDGTFPNHTPNPAEPKNTKELQKQIKQGKYDLGICYDGDCDRAFFIDENGKRIPSVKTLLLFAQHIIKKGQKILYTVNSGRVAEEFIPKWEGKAIAVPIGHTEVQREMIKHDAVLGAELSGHFYFKKFKYGDSGDLAALTILTLLSQTDKTISELIKPFDKYQTSEELNFKVKDRETVRKKLKKRYAKFIIKSVDGVSVNTGKFWFNFRISNTQPLVRLVVEAKDQKTLKNAIKEITQYIH